MANFQKAFEYIINKEGGYVNDPYDKGGETKYGISKSTYPNLDIKNLTLEDAKKIYYRDFWLKSKAYLMPEPLAIMHFDTAVNAGVKNANKILQRALNRQGFNLVIDGIIGEKTLKALKNAVLQQLLSDYTIERTRYYIRTGNKRYLRGWINRSLSTYDFALKHSAAAALGIALIIFIGYLLGRSV